MAFGKGKIIMAYDRIITVRTRLDKCLNYAMNSAKNERHLCAAINCNAETAYADMEATKERWNRKGGVLGYHIVHSYKPGEVTAEQAQALGLEFARRLLGDKYEAVVSTHVDRNHLHCHIVFNSVSFVDGSKYLNTFKDYFGDIRGISNDVSRENGLSVIEPKGRGKHYAEWNADKQSKPTIRASVRKDIDYAIARAFSIGGFFSALEKQGYSIKRGPNIKHTAVRPPGGSRFIRLDSLGAEYTEDAIKRRIVEGAKEKPQRPHIPVRRYRLKSGNTRQRRKLKGFQALYVHYLYYLGIRKPKGKKRQLPFEVREDVKRLDQYRRQFHLLHRYRIETAEHLSMLQDALQTEIESLTDARKPLYKYRRKGADVQPEIDSINKQLRKLRSELYTCIRIEESEAHIRSNIELCHNTQQEPIKTEKSEKRRSDLWR